MGTEQKNNHTETNEKKEELVDDSILSQYFIAMLDKIFDPIPVPFIILDENCIIRMINDVFAEYLGFKKDYIIGKQELQVDKYSRFPYVYKTKQAEIAWKHTFENGKTAIVHRLIVLDKNDKVKYGVGLVLFEDLVQFRDVIEKNKILETELNLYKSKLIEMHGAKYSWHNIIGNSEKMSQAKFTGKRAAQSNSNVLILGESGTGKELFANSIHNDSVRSHNHRQLRHK